MSVYSLSSEIVSELTVITDIGVIHYWHMILMTELTKTRLIRGNCNRTDHHAIIQQLCPVHYGLISLKMPIQMCIRHGNIRLCAHLCHYIITIYLQIELKFREPLYRGLIVRDTLQVQGSFSLMCVLSYEGWNQAYSG